MISAEEAYALNLVTWVVPASDVDAFVADLAARLVAGPPVALAQTKALLHEGVDRTMRDALANEARAQAVNFAGSDVAEGAAAFAEKRVPVFTGRWGVGAALSDAAGASPNDAAGASPDHAASVSPNDAGSASPDHIAGAPPDDAVGMSPDDEEVSRA
jgi:hypothetical protein